MVFFKVFFKAFTTIVKAFFDFFFFFFKKKLFSHISLFYLSTNNAQQFTCMMGEMFFFS